MPAQLAGGRLPELVGGLDHQPHLLPAGGHLPPGAALGDVDPVAGAVVQRAEFGLQSATALVREAQQVAVDIADVERHGFGPAAEQDPAVGVREQQQRRTARVGGVARAELAGEAVNRAERAGGAEGGRVVAP